MIPLSSGGASSLLVSRKNGMIAAKTRAATMKMAGRALSAPCRKRS
jgi:hypothetical protein